MPRLRTFAVNVKWADWPATEITHISPGRAKAAYLRDLKDAYEEAKYTDLTCRSLGEVRTNEQFIRVAKYRGVEHAYMGMKVKCGDDFGVLVGANSSSNFEVLFTSGRHSNQVLSCHPNFKMTYYNEGGIVIADFND